MGKGEQVGELSSYRHETWRFDEGIGALGGTIGLYRAEGMGS